MTTGERIRDRRRALNLSADELASEVGVSRSTIFRYENGDIEKLPANKLEAFALALHTTVEYLMGWTTDPIDYDDGELIAEIPLSYMGLFDGDVKKAYSFMQAVDENAAKERLKPPQNIIPLPKMKKIPLIGNIACGIPILAEENVEDFVDCPETVHANFALRCKGDSMIGARILDGDVVYIRSQPEVENGEIAAVVIDGEATLKRFYRRENSVVLQPENPAYEPLVFVGKQLDAIRIAGKAVAFLSSIK